MLSHGAIVKAIKAALLNPVTSIQFSAAVIAHSIASTGASAQELMLNHDMIGKYHRNISHSNCNRIRCRGNDPCKRWAIRNADESNCHSSTKCCIFSASTNWYLQTLLSSLRCSAIDVLLPKLQESLTERPKVLSELIAKLLYVSHTLNLRLIFLLVGVITWLWFDQSSISTNCVYHHGIDAIFTNRYSNTQMRWYHRNAC